MLVKECPMTPNQPQTLLLSDLRPGDEAVVASLTAKGGVKQRLMEMGLTRGAAVRVEKCAPMGDPLEISVKGYHLSLRRKDCRGILVDAMRAAAPGAPQDGKGGPR